MRSRGRPKESQVRLKNGFYIEVCDMGAKKGLKIRRESKNEMDYAASLYSKHKYVIVLGEFRDGELVSKAKVTS